MKRVNSCSSYSQFRRKNPSVGQSPHKQIGISEIDSLAKQLQTINSVKKINILKYELLNGIIEVDQEQDFSCPNTEKKMKAQNNPTKKLKAMQAKMEAHHTIKPETAKLNKTIHGNLTSRRQKDKEKQREKDSKQVNIKNSVKLDKKDELNSKITRRMSLTNLHMSMKSSIISTNESINTTNASINDKIISTSEKKVLLEKIRTIENKIEKKTITVDGYEQLLEKIEKMEQLLQNF